MSIVQFDPSKKKKEPILVKPKMICLLNNRQSYGSFFIDDGLVTYSLINIIGDGTLFAGTFRDPKFPMIYNDGNPVSMIFGDVDSYRTEIIDLNDNVFGTMTLITRENDKRRRINIFIQNLPPYDLDGMMWGIDKVCIDCNQCPVQKCPSRGKLPWREN